MIRIQHRNLDHIAESYQAQVEPACLERASFFLQLILVLYHGAPTATLLAHPLHGSTKKILANILLTTELTDQANYHLVSTAHVKPAVDIHQHQLTNMIRHLNDPAQLKKIMLVRPDDAAALNTALNTQFGIVPANRTIFYNVVRQIIKYELFNDHAYRIAGELGLSTCPYCNRNFIHTVIDRDNKEIIRPTFDHFFSQVDHPFLSLSFFNLIPSCYNCNSNLKGDTPMTLDSHMHPYMEGYNNDAVFHVLLQDNKPDKSDPENYALSVINKQFPPGAKHRRIFGQLPGEGNLELFQIQEIYRAHLDVVGELVVKCDRLSKGYAHSLASMFSELRTDKAEFYRFYFGNYFNEKDFHRRPLAKMSKDIVEQILPLFTKT